MKNVGQGWQMVIDKYQMVDSPVLPSSTSRAPFYQSVGGEGEGGRQRSAESCGGSKLFFSGGRVHPWYRNRISVPGVRPRLHHVVREGVG